MILVDANVLMYASGAAHPNKAPALSFLNRVAREEVQAAIDAEVLQEIIHRYSALRRWPEGRDLYDFARGLFAQILPITADVTDRAKHLVDADNRIAARDAVHAAVVMEYRLEGICTFDRDFDRIRGCRRVGIG
jgi:predicted nucleic acid-binding protein